jgi:predicted permease
MAAEQAGPRGPLGRRLLRGSLELARRAAGDRGDRRAGAGCGGGSGCRRRWRGPLTQIGESTPTLAFLTIGLGLDLGALRGQARPLALISALKLGVTPTLAALVLLALDVRGEAAQVAVLQSAMPTAVVAGIIAGEAGCDRGLSSAAPVVTTLLAMATLPLVVMAARAIGL